MKLSTAEKNTMGSHAGSKSLFAVSASNDVIENDCCVPFLGDLLNDMQKLEPDRMTFSCYRAGAALTELIFWHTQSVRFVLTIWEGDFRISPVSEDDMRVAHKELILPDITDIMLLVARIAAHTGLQPSPSSEMESPSVFVFTACPR